MPQVHHEDTNIVFRFKDLFWLFLVVCVYVYVNVVFSDAKGNRSLLELEVQAVLSCPM